MPTWTPKVTRGRGEGSRVVCEVDQTSLIDNPTIGDNRHNVGMLAVLWCSLLDDTPVDSANKPDSLFRSFVKQLQQDPVGLITQYSRLYDELTSSLIRDDMGKATISHFIIEFKDTPIFREYHEFYKTHDALVLRFISTFLTFGKKFYYEDPNFNEAAFRGWLEVEEHLQQVVIEGDFLKDLREIIAWALEGFDDNLFLPKHGPGAVAERGVRTVIDKNGSLVLDQELFQALGDLTVDVGPSFVPPDPNSNLVQGASQLKFVPKSIGKARSICMEPATYQFAQQGVRLWVERALADGPLGRHIPLGLQERNCDLARYGSRTGRVDTIDLSAASDSVHADLVMALFEDPLRDYLMVTRTDQVDTGYADYREYELRKFAPMGSALCFPIQSIVYAAIVVHASLAWQFGETAGSYLKLDRRTMPYYYGKIQRSRTFRQEPFSIYGDDIICDYRITPIVIETLTLLGFTVNEGKSFTGNSSFRESCGGFFFDGEDVTPIKAKLGKVSDTISISVLASVIELANRAYDYGYLNLRQHLIRIALYHPITGVKHGLHDKSSKNAILFSDDRDASLALFTEDPHNRHLQCRSFDINDTSRGDTAQRYMRKEYKSLGAKPWRSVTMSSGEDWYRHLLWWRAQLETQTDSFVSKKIPVTTGPRWRWTSRFGD